MTQGDLISSRIYNTRKANISVSSATKHIPISGGCRTRQARLLLGFSPLWNREVVFAKLVGLDLVGNARGRGFGDPPGFQDGRMRRKRQRQLYQVRICLKLSAHIHRRSGLVIYCSFPDRGVRSSNWRYCGTRVRGAGTSSVREPSSRPRSIGKQHGSRRQNDLLDR